MDEIKNDRHAALVLSGGGATGAYEIGVMKALFEGCSASTSVKPLKVRSFVGTSVGAYNAAFMASKTGSEAQALAGLEKIWRDRIADTGTSCGNGVYRLRGLPLQRFDIGCLQHPSEIAIDAVKDGTALAKYALTYGTAFLRSNDPPAVRLLHSFNLGALFAVEPLQNLIKDTIDLEELAQSHKKLTVVATDWKRGKASEFSKADILKDGHKAIQASASIPGIFPLAYIDGVAYADGGVAMNTPLQPAIEAGADDIHVIYMDPSVSEIPLPHPPNTLSTMTRAFDIIFSNQMNANIEKERTNNRIIKALENQPDAESRDHFLAQLKQVLDLSEEHLNRVRSDRPVTIHRYRPQKDLTPLLGMLGWLNFSAKNIEKLIELGYKDASEHDCETSKCVRVLT